MANVLITGASGLLGQPLSELLMKNGHSVTHIGRKEKLQGKIKCYQWDIGKGTIDPRAFENIDTVVHLAGAGIADSRWTDERKKEIIDSRVQSGKMLINAINERKGQIRTFIGASAIGYYGAITNETIYTETMPPHTDFMASVCTLWEESYNGDAQTRKVIVRIGVVLSHEGGAFLKLSKTAKMGIASPLGSGKQYMPWIHIDDMAGVIFEAITNTAYTGIYNAVTPQHINNTEFTRELAKAYGKPMFMPKVPAFLLKLMLGEMANIVLEGSRVSCEKLQKQGFTFQFPEITGAFANLSKRA
ncbi:MAG: epimerase [Bacteroidetes bacterium]|jgi:uncharacterized protein (TIGR01777 family)|nr:epimerase [Bacteroidota bacterium]